MKSLALGSRRSSVPRERAGLEARCSNARQLPMAAVPTPNAHS
jgi:hypothetical protein